MISSQKATTIAAFVSGWCKGVFFPFTDGKLGTKAPVILGNNQRSKITTPDQTVPTKGKQNIQMSPSILLFPVLLSKAL